MKPKDLPKYVIILKRGQKTRYRYPLNDGDLGIMLDIAARQSETLIRMYRCHYERIPV